MSGDGDKRKRRRGAFARPGDPLDLAPLPFSTRRKKNDAPPKVDMPPPRVRPRLDEPVDDPSSVDQALKDALGFDLDATNDPEDSFLDDMAATLTEDDDVFAVDDDLAATMDQHDEDIGDLATEPTPPPLSIRATVSTVRKPVERVPDSLPDPPRARARVSIRPAKVDTIPDNLPQVSLPPASAGGHTADLANLVEVNKAEPSLDTSYGHGYQPDEDVSVYDSHSDDSLFDLVARNDNAERSDDPPSDVVEFGPISSRKEVVVREDPNPQFSDRPRKQDATVFQDEKKATRKRGPQNHAWWERSTPSAAPGPSPRKAPEARKTWRTPGQLDLRERTAQRERRGRFARLAVILVVLLLVSVGAYALVKKPNASQTDPARTANPAHPAELEALEDVAAGPSDEAPSGEQEPETPEAPPAEEPVEEPVEAPAEETPVVAEQPADEPIQATEELEIEAHKALYETGVLVVTSSPRALVWVDGKRIGHTPIQALELEPGTHRIKAVVPGRAPKYQSVRVDPGGAHQVPFNF